MADQKWTALPPAPPPPPPVPVALPYGHSWSAAPAPTAAPGYPYPQWPAPTWPPPAPPPAPAAPAGRPRGGVVAAATLAFIGLIAGTLAAVQLSSSPHPAARVPSSTSAPVIPGRATPSGQPTTSAAGGIPGRVDPAIVDITTTLQGGRAAGTGMILSADGEVLTNNHVIAGAQSITINVAGTGPSRPATVVGYDATHDVAVIQITGGSGLPTVTIGDSSAVAIGDPVVALGNALGKGGTPAVANGKVTALDQTVTASGGVSGSETLTGMIETNAPIQPGDSGGPLVDSSARVIGMNTAGSSSGRRTTTASLGYAIPISSALDIAHQIEQGQGSSTIQIGTRGIIGVQVSDSTGKPGALVSGVEPGSPAESAGIKAGDVITAVKGRPVDSGKAMGEALTGGHPGDKVDVAWVDAAGKDHTAAVTLVPGPPN